MNSPFVLSEAVKAFDGFDKPATYIVDDLYESERADYEEMLGGRPREHLVADDFGPTTWSPLCYLTPAAMAYLFPRLMELALSDARDKWGELFMMRFINHFSFGPSGAAFLLLSPGHRDVVASFLEHLACEHGELVREECWDDALGEGIHCWRNA